MKKSLLRVAAVVLACMMLVGCGSLVTLETILNTDSAKQELEGTREQVLSQFEGVYSDYSFAVEGNNLTYNYYYSEDFDDEALDQVKEALEATEWSDTINSVKDEIEASAKIRPETVTFAYFNADGSREVFKVTE